MSLLQKIFRNVSAQVVSRIVSSGTGFFIALLIARYFGIGGYADIAKITAFVGLCYLAVDLGANAIFLQMQKQEQQFGQLLLFRLFLSLVLFLGVCLLLFVLPYNNATTSGYSPLVKIGIAFFSLSFFTRAFVYSAGALFQQDFSYSKATYATIVSSVITLGIVLTTVFLGLPILWIIAGYFFGGVGEALISLYFVRSAVAFPKPEFYFFKKIFLQTLPLTILLFLNLLYFRIDMIILALFQPASAVGLYDYAYKYFDFLIALPLFLSNSLYPHLIRTYNNLRIPKKSIGLYTLGFFFLGIFLIPFVWFGSPFIALIKNDFIPSILPLRILSLSLPIFFATNILQWIFITKKKQLFLVWVYGLSLLLNVFLNLLFIPHFSYVAASIITDICEGGILLAMGIYVLIHNL